MIMSRVKSMRNLVLGILLCALPAAAQTCTTSVCNATGVSKAAFLAALPSSLNANATVVVNIPSGSASWTTGFSYTIPAAVTNLTIQGTTTVSCSGSEGTSGYSCTPTDGTTISDAYVSNSPLMTFQVGGSTTKFRITGLSIKGGAIGSTGHSKYDGWIQINSGSSQNVRIDHNNFDTTTETPTGNQITLFKTFAPIAGVADHNAIKFVPAQYDNGFNALGYQGSTSPDAAWATATQWGASTTFYVEANYMTGGGIINDCASGASMVIRYNTVVSVQNLYQTHATKSDAGVARGCRMIEVYKNSITAPSAAAIDAAGGVKDGPAMIWGNTMNNGYERFFAPSTDRNINPANVNENAGQPTDWGYCGTNINGTGSTWDGNQSTALGYPCLDGVGRGVGDLLNNAGSIASELNTTTGTQAWPHQKLEPVYMFANSITPGSGVETQVRDQTTTLDRDVYEECNTGLSDSTCASSAFNGTHGTGSGLLAARPSTCTAGVNDTFHASPTGHYGVAYWATDANSGKGELYVCTATNTWTAIYQPFTYPHPLISGGGGSSLITTTTAIGAASTSLTAGSSDLLTASVSPSSGPTGTMTFFDGGSSIGTCTISGGSCTHNVTSITAGTHSYTASYGGDSTYASSTSSSVTVTATSVIVPGAPSGFSGKMVLQ
jgi:hypothetical protein